MKKTMILVAFAALISLASCQKEEIIDNGPDNQTSPVFTASIAGATKTTVNLTDGKVAWEETDEITVTDASSASALYEIESIDETTGKATFVIKDGETALGAGPYTATYGTEPATTQTYSATAGKLYMTATATSSNSFTFEVQCGLMKLNLIKAGESVKSIAVTSSTNAIYTLTCDPAQSIASAKDFCIALPEGSYKKIEIMNASFAVATLNSTSGVAVASNHIKPVTFGKEKLNFLPTRGTAEATIDGVKTFVNWVQLWSGGPKFAEYNIGATSATEYGGYYTWGGTYKNGNGITWNDDHNTTNMGSGNLSGTEDTATKIWGSNWRMPTDEECEALYENCTMEQIDGVNNTYLGTSAIGCLFSGNGVYVSNSVFLTTAGACVSGSVIFPDILGFYWSSTPENQLKAIALALNNMGPVGNSERGLGCSVRAVLNE